MSPYRRTHQTLRLLGLDPVAHRVREEPRLREQDWGNWQDREDVRQQKAYRDAYGHFFYRFAQGESGADVYDRVARSWRACAAASRTRPIRRTSCW